MLSKIICFYQLIKRYHLTIVVLVILFACCLRVPAQDDNAYVCTNGKISFFSPAVTGDIDATSNAALCVINTKTKKVSAKVQQSSFNFKQRLMQEHFNENYMETGKYPYGVLDMQISNNVDFTHDGTFDVTLKGTFEVHGVKVTREIKGRLVIKNGEPVNATATFNVNLEDHKIKIPSIVGATIAKDVKVDIDFTFEKYKKI